ncbi:tyrosine-type recombinase/integrase [Deinococcus aerophilus]|uniref:Integrase n=1 Tax=Deinococcus aerophilus TaxID=522488 RepID=A0ABQ2H062_9DEIO|nr:tyrosine-type recombinase/integrase [Deinococcus aerophilus]GGM22603.1 integrase [Deinococcus aerophilus]
MTLVPITSALALSDLTDQALRVRAVQAAATYDTDTLCQVLLAYMRSGSRQGARTSPRTLTAYGVAARDYVPWAQNHGISLLRPGHRDGGRYLAHLQERPSAGRGRRGTLAPATIAQYVAGARALHRALTWAGATDASPFLTTSAPADRTPAIERRPPYRDELEQLLAACEPRLAALLLLCAHGGLRAGEALAVRTHDLEGARLVVHGKGGKLRRVPLSRRTREALVGLAPVDPDGRLFDWTYAQAAYRMRQASRAAGLPGYWRGFHAARKHGGTRLYAKVRDFTRVSLFLGHASVDTTRRYVAVDPDDVAAEVEDF